MTSEQIQEAIDTLQGMIEGESWVLGDMRAEGKLKGVPEETRVLRALVAGQNALKDKLQVIDKKKMQLGIAYGKQ